MLGSVFLILTLIVVLSSFLIMFQNFKKPTVLLTNPKERSEKQIVERVNTISKSKDFIKKYSSTIHLFDHDESERRLAKTQQIWKEYDVIPNLFRGLNAKNKMDREVLETLPLKERSIVGAKKRLGAYGLAGGFYQCIVDAYNRNLPYLLFLEDDSVPLLHLSPEDFHATLMRLVDSIPDNDGVYQLSTTVYCRQKKSVELSDVTWIPVKGKSMGCTAMLYTRSSIKILLDYIHKNKIEKPIDHISIDIFPNAFYKLNGPRSESGMFSGIFEQIETYCKKRNNIMTRLVHETTAK